MSSTGKIISLPGSEGLSSLQEGDHNEIDQESILDEAVKQCISVLTREGKPGILALPTDTLYGVATDVNTVDSLYELKKRDYSKPVAICVGEISQIKTYADVSHLPEGLLEDMLPGAVTILLPRTDELPQDLNPGITNVGIRIPDHKFINKLCIALKSPLALTSANLSGKKSATCIDDFEELFDKIDIILDAGKVSDDRAGSTVVDLSAKNQFKIIRDGVMFSETVDLLKEKYGFEQAEK